MNSTKKVIILWDIAIQTKGKIKNNRPDIGLTVYKRETCLLIDMSEPKDD